MVRLHILVAAICISLFMAGLGRAVGLSFCDQAGPLATIGDRINANLLVHDPNNDGQVDGQEIYNEGKINYDLNEDTCISRAEFVYHYVKVFKISIGFAEAFLNSLVGPNGDEKCLYNYSIFKDSLAVVNSVQGLANDMSKALIGYCDADLTRYGTNCDCAQLPSMCQHDARFNTLNACVEYNNKLVNSLG